ncbi:glycerophosphoryl diester phosphodiesterase membrane domain-containing protein [Lipingzhangella sp. LS1_29]|uniref:Glycerophosphoryl diester phosphodiesterase membrane domain-containing protein n=1 Tax=Lipingzhangella rawalii TaxID=2055835 RepID=A0ABU2H532_9ACTN|nr:glycerophosphoryl diester phosphodiesterase membrane domain-containing protein [Lipingzhangella rawalii]MDS1270417.1 glycerophosphoryl diester phosphodiesterase membrane domain-containing protein [Lipingzhangella rawalii]
MSLGDILNGAFTYIRRNPKATLGLAVLVMAVASLVQAIAFTAVMDEFFGVMRQIMVDPMAAEELDTMPTAGLGLSYGGALLEILGRLVLVGLLTVVVGSAVLGRTVSMGQAWEAARGRLPAVFGVVGLVLVASVVWLAAVAAAIMVGVVVATAVDQILGVILGLVGAAATVGLGVWLYVRFALALPAVVLERAGPLRALGRSWNLTAGSWWRIFGILLLAELLIFLVTEILMTPFSLGAAAVLFLGADTAWAAVVASALLFLGTLLLLALTTPFTVGVTALLYVDRRIRREGLDLRLQTAQGDSTETRIEEIYAVPSTASPSGGWGR